MRRPSAVPPAPTLMRYALLVLESPAAGTSSQAALRFARAAVARGHQVARVFFYGDGVAAGNSNSCPPQDEADHVAAWRDFALAGGTELVVCIAAALRRGVLDAGEAERYERAAANLDPAFVLSGLGQLAEAVLDADRLVTFGG